MTQADKDLLLKDLGARLPYGCVVQIDSCGIWNLRGIDHDFTAELRDHVIVWHGPTYPSSKNTFPISSCKPYLFPLSSMNLDQRIEYSRTLIIFDESHCSQTHETYDWLNKNHFDYRGLIPMGLAIDATGKNIY